MKKVYQHNEIDWSDEGGQSMAMLSEAEVHRFYLSLTSRQQIVLTYLLAKENPGDIARFLGISIKSVQIELAGIKKSWKSYK